MHVECVQVSAFGGVDHAESLPHLLHSGNTSQIDITLDGLHTDYTHSRFGLHLITASSERTNKTTDLHFRKTMDDEHAPGVFTVSLRVYLSEMFPCFSLIWENF